MQEKSKDRRILFNPLQNNTMNNTNNGEEKPCGHTRYMSLERFAHLHPKWSMLHIQKFIAIRCAECKQNIEDLDLIVKMIP